MLLASVGAAILVAGAFAVLILAVSSLREATEQGARSKDLTTATLALDKLVLDLERGVRGFVLTGSERLLQPWTEARRDLPRRLAAFERLAAANPAQRRRARRLADAIRGYSDDYSANLVRIARETPAAAREADPTAEGRQRIDEIRRLFARVLAAENALATKSAMAANDEAERAVALAAMFLLASATVIALFGLYLARSIGRPVRQVAHGAARLAAGELDLRLPETGPGEVGELTRSFNVMAERLSRGRRELEEQNDLLRQSEQLKSELVSIVSHEVRTPLASVLGFTSLLLQRDVDVETRRHYLGIVDAQARRLAALLDDFLDVQRIEEGRLPLTQEVVDVAAVLRDQTQLFTAQSARHRLQLTVADQPLAVHGDAGRIAQVVGNLLSNAIKYSPEGGVVAVVGEQRNGSVRVSVSDEGLGIPADQQARIFTKFFRGDAAASGISGTGLGLAFARAVVEAHGGQIAFTSDEGRGTTFWIELPAAVTS